ncbi:MAG TPA: hypothetical protein PLX54_05360 [Candidatus Fermentibacter daniensis]|jgi:hypothetical protein|nr:MAG: hypothetical protein AO396_06155 [Candidatus Fermentibacter daniensis]MBP7720420.1 hypothetical protein [Candidatus Fermentibacter sp.]OQC69873.1 MAG: hypothetical protein BWX47_00851 [candidate division Hyd24-12 bacterium ADurb.Bin004]KZD18844.1 MAG: hypothetical protein AO395_09020 [Candidatus Fermentibacter daniensis]KZD20197.1 MAG: hypothetical protein AO394_08575 [Candidatus Fermentibacter daniensis]
MRALRSLLLLVALLLLSASSASAQEARMEGGRLILEEITIQGELRTPQAMFLILKSTPSLSNVLLERSFMDDVIRPIYPGAFADEPTFGASRRIANLPWYLRYGTVAAFGGLSAFQFSEGDEEEGLVFGVIAGLGLVGNLVLDLVGK